MMTDPIADLCTRIRNANTNHAKKLSIPASRLKVGILQVLKEEGFIEGYTVEPKQPQSSITIQLKYSEDGEQLIRKIERISKPGRRVYAGTEELPPVLRGMGIRVLSTPKGILSDRAARAQKVGGEILCEIY